MPLLHCCLRDLSLHYYQVIKEERRLARDKAAYARIRQAYASSVKRPTGHPAALTAAAAGGPAGLGLAGGQLDLLAPAARRAAAGAVAAAARELRPIELVGLYETQKEAVERELAAAKAEVTVYVYTFVFWQKRL
jgi:hypothetical protein